MTDHWRSWIPVLTVQNANESMRFYCDMLGFQKDWEHQFEDASPIYASVSRDTLTLHLSEHGDDRAPITLVVAVDNVDAVFADLGTRGLAEIDSPQDQPYGVRTFTITDPDGHQLIFSTPLSNFDNAPGRSMN